MGLVAAAMIAAPAAQAKPVGATLADERPAPPPASIAASAGERQQDLRSPDARDAATSGAASARKRQQDLRTPDTRDAATTGAASTAAAGPVAEPVPTASGFDWLAVVAIGAAVTTGLALVSWRALGMRQAVGRRAAG
jgi:hypothetical protein